MNSSASVCHHSLPRSLSPSLSLYTLFCFFPTRSGRALALPAPFTHHFICYCFIHLLTHTHTRTNTCVSRRGIGWCALLFHERIFGTIQLKFTAGVVKISLPKQLTEKWMKCAETNVRDFFAALMENNCRWKVTQVLAGGWKEVLSFEALSQVAQSNWVAALTELVYKIYFQCFSEILV